MKMSKNVFQLMACLSVIGGFPALACEMPVLAAQVSSSSSSSCAVNLGAKYSSDQTVITIRPQDSQDVKSVKLNVYQATASAVKGQNEKYTMKQNGNSWTYTLPGDWKGTCYNFTIHYKDGSSKTETDPFGTALTQNKHFSVIGESGEQANPSVSTSSTSVIDAQSSSASSSASSISGKTSVSSLSSTAQSSAKNSSVSASSSSDTNSSDQASTNVKAKVGASSDATTKANGGGTTGGGVTPAANKEAAVGNGGATQKDTGDNGKGGNDKAVAVGSANSSSSTNSSNSSADDGNADNGNDNGNGSSSSQSTLPQTGTDENGITQWGTIGVGALFASGLATVPTLADRKRK